MLSLVITIFKVLHPTEEHLHPNKRKTTKFAFFLFCGQINNGVNLFLVTNTRIGNV